MPRPLRPARLQAPQAWPVRLVTADTVVAVAAEAEAEVVVVVAAGWAVRVVGRAEEAWLPQAPERAWEEHRR